MILNMIEIRHASRNDLENVAYIEKEWKKEGISRNMELTSKSEIKRAIDDKRVLIATKEGVVGMLLFIINNSKSCEIDSLYVKRKFRNKGVAKKLMENFLRIVRIRNCRKIYVHADSLEEKHLIDFYKRFNFRKTAVLMIRKQ